MSTDETATSPTLPSGKATRINLFSFSTPQMRAFHMSWFAFFLCFLAWFGLAPFMPTIRAEMKLTPEQVKWAGIAAVAITFFARLGFGRLCDAIGPRLTYTILLVVGSLPVMAVGLAHSFPAFLVARLLIGIIGASFVITQYHTSMMFAPNVVGTANAMTGGWGNMGGGFTQQVMPIAAGWAMAAGVSRAGSWRLCMLAAGVVCLLTGIAYFFMTQDTPAGNLIPLRKAGTAPPAKPRSFSAAAADPRTWCLFLIYASCFGIELTIESQPLGTYNDKLTRGEFDLSGASQFAPDPDVLRRLHLPEGRPAASVSKVDDAEISAWLKQGTREPDGESRAELYRRVQRKLVELAYAFPIYVLLYTIATTDAVHDLTIDTHGFPEFHSAWLSA